MLMNEGRPRDGHSSHSIHSSGAWRSADHVLPLSQMWDNKGTRWPPEHTRRGLAPNIKHRAGLGARLNQRSGSKDPAQGCPSLPSHSVVSKSAVNEETVLRDRSASPSPAAGSGEPGGPSNPPSCQQKGKRYPGGL